MRREGDFFGDRELELIYIAKRLKEALQVETLLTDLGIDYAVETDQYRGGIIFAHHRIGAFFYVLPESAESAKEMLRANRLRPQ